LTVRNFSSNALVPIMAGAVSPPSPCGPWHPEHRVPKTVLPACARLATVSVTRGVVGVGAGVGVGVGVNGGVGAGVVAGCVAGGVVADGGAVVLAGTVVTGGVVPGPGAGEGDGVADGVAPGFAEQAVVKTMLNAVNVTSNANPV
jgi:hypothetical protein